MHLYFRFCEQQLKLMRMLLMSDNVAGWWNKLAQEKILSICLAGIYRRWSEYTSKISWNNAICLNIVCSSAIIAIIRSELHENSSAISRTSMVYGRLRPLCTCSSEIFIYELSLFYYLLCLENILNYQTLKQNDDKADGYWFWVILTSSRRHIRPMRPPILSPFPCKSSQIFSKTF